MKLRVHASEVAHFAAVQEVAQVRAHRPFGVEEAHGPIMALAAHRCARGTAPSASKPSSTPWPGVSPAAPGASLNRPGNPGAVQIEIALALEPRILLLDEPTAGMSPEETAAMRAMIARLPATLTLPVIEHDMEVVFGLADRITALDYGKVLLQGKPGEVRDSEVVRSRYPGTQ